MAGRELDLRDSTIQNSLNKTRKGRGCAEQQQQHQTPWGTSLDDGTVEPPPHRTLSSSKNNAESDETAGSYTTPEVSRAHNHYQNKTTEQVGGKLKMSYSRINEGTFSLVHDEKGNGGQTQTTAPAEAAPNPPTPVRMSRINDGHDIFGPVETGGESASRQKGREEPFQERHSTHFISQPWFGYTDAQKFKADAPS